jgi:aldose 1-epimerase
MQTADDNIRLLYPGDAATQELVVSPFGASLRGYRVRHRAGPAEIGWQDVIWGYRDAAEKQGGQGDVLCPFPGRIPDGKYRFGGRDLELPCNDKESHAAIHGFARTRRWEPIVEAPLRHEEPRAEVSFRLRIEEGEHPGYPFGVQVVVRYALEARALADEPPRPGMTCSFQIHNHGRVPAPIGIGFHPYFVFDATSVDEVRLEMPAERALEFAGLLPTGKVLGVAGSDLDFSRPRKIGATRLNHCFEVREPASDEEDLAVCRLEMGARRTTVWMEASRFRYVVAYTGDALPSGIARRGIAIEPMTCATDAFNHPDWGLQVLEPGALFAGSYGVIAE